MKRRVSIILACLLVAIMALGLCACGKSNNGGGEKDTTKAVETKAPEKDTTAPAETKAPETKEAGNTSNSPLVSDETHFVIDEGTAILSYEHKGNDIIGCICYIEVGSPELAAAAAEVINSGEDTEGYEYEVLGAVAYEGYVGIVFGADAWEGFDVSDLQAAVDLGAFTKLE